MKKSLFFVLTVLLLSLVLVSCENSVSTKGTLHLISVGDNFAGSDVQELHSCINDANAVKEVFEKRATESGMSFTSTVLTSNEGGSSQATVSNLQTALSDLKTTASSNDISVIFLSTHGNNNYENKKVDYNSSNKDDAYFILVNSDGKFYFTELIETAEQIPGTVLIIADLCFSGALIDQNNVTYNVNNYTGSDPVKLLFSDGTVKESSKLFVLAASTYFQKSFGGKDNELSVFTDYMLKALGISSYDSGITYASSIPAKKGNKILLSDIYGYVYKESKKDNAGQVVQMSSGTNDLVLFSY